MSHPLSRSDALVFSHMGFYVRDLDRMARFYKDVMCFFETDRGDLGAVKLVFLSRDPSEHHQVVLDAVAYAQVPDVKRVEVKPLVFRDPVNSRKLSSVSE